jgi:hypothetical protein
MRREYDVFEKFSDGSTLWRATVAGRFEALRKMQELGEYSDNEFFTLDVQAGRHLQPKLFTGNARPMTKSAVVA